jgi:hypothetical protein
MHEGTNDQGLVEARNGCLGAKHDFASIIGSPR